MSSHAQAFVYWGDGVHATDVGDLTSAVGRANPDGTGVNPSFIPTGPVGLDSKPCAVAVDGRYVYWATYKSIGRANLDGTGVNPSFITTDDGARSGCALAVDGGHIYWANGDWVSGSLGRANLDGTDVNQTFITTNDPYPPCAVAVDRAHIYWADYGRPLGRANLDGTGANRNFIAASPGWRCGVAVDSGHIYWSEYRSIGRANLDGTGANPRFIPYTDGPDYFAGADEICGVAVDAGHVYWANAMTPGGDGGDQWGTTLGRATLDGTGANWSFITTHFVPCGVAVDAPETRITSGPSGAPNDPTPTFAFQAAKAGYTFECRLDSGVFNPCVSPKTLAHLADGPHTFTVRAKDAVGNVDPTPDYRAFTVKTAAVAVSNSSLVVSAASGAKDNLVVTRPSSTILRVTDLASGPYTGSGVHTGAGCTRVGDYTADCTASTITLVASGDRADRITNSTAIPSSLNGGSGNDELIGGASNDTITGAAGADSMRGMNGNDSLLARDLASDAAINCDGGTTAGATDTSDLDLLPLDPNSVVTGCETKTRH